MDYSTFLVTNIFSLLNVVDYLCPHALAELDDRKDSSYCLANKKFLTSLYYTGLGILLYHRSVFNCWFYGINTAFNCFMYETQIGKSVCR